MMWKFLARQAATKTGKWSALAAIGSWIGVATGHMAVQDAIEITTIAGGYMFLRDKDARKEQEDRENGR